MAQTDERRAENPQRLARYQLQRPFQCAIDVTATCESSKLDLPEQSRHGAPIHASVADTERHLFCKQVDVGAKPTGGPISTFPSWCNRSISRCERDGAGAEPAEGTNFNRAQPEEADPVVCKSTLLGATAMPRQRQPDARSAILRRRSRSGAHVHFASEV